MHEKCVGSALKRNKKKTRSGPLQKKTRVSISISKVSSNGQMMTQKEL